MMEYSLNEDFSSFLSIGEMMKKGATTEGRWLHLMLYGL